MRATQAPPRGSHLFKGPMLLGQTRKDIAELVACVWLVVEVSRFARTRLVRH